MEDLSCLRGSGFGLPVVLGAAEDCVGVLGVGVASSDADGVVVEESDCECESLIEETPVESVAVQLGRKRRERETSGSSETVRALVVLRLSAQQRIAI